MVRKTKCTSDIRYRIVCADKGLVTIEIMRDRISQSACLIKRPLEAFVDRSSIAPAEASQKYNRRFRSPISRSPPKAHTFFRAFRVRRALPARQLEQKSRRAAASLQS